MNGYILWESAAVVAIATMKSSNRKTGNMVQTWIIRRDMLPTEALKTGKDSAICGDCPLRGNKGQARTCYVNVGQAPQGIYRAYQAGKYPMLKDNQVFAGRKVRLGAYGDPSKVPVSVWHNVLEHAAGWTGYTHQWRKAWAQGLKGLVMASCDTEQDQADATAKGWRTFLVRAEGQPLLSGEIDCPSPKVSCEQCGLCCGTARKARNIAIPVHGTGKKYLETLN